MASYQGKEKIHRREEARISQFAIDADSLFSCPFLDEDDELLIPPDNFAMVEPGIYRSGFPAKKNFPFLKSLNLRTILYLCPEEYPETNLSFLTGIHVQLLQYGVAGNKEPFLEIPHSVISEALVQILDVRNHPLLIHCNKGKHRTGCMVGILRRVLDWSLASIFEEYRVFSSPKERFVDQQFIECWEMTLPTTHALYEIIKERLSKSATNRRGSILGPDGKFFDSSVTPRLSEELAGHIVNPEANERRREREAKNAAAAAARAEMPPTLAHAASVLHMNHPQSTNSNHQAQSNVSTPASTIQVVRTLGHHHTQSQPTLSPAPKT